MTGRPNARVARVAAATALAALSGTAAAAAMVGDQIVTPSGLIVTYLDDILEDQASGGSWLTLRFVSPAIGTGAGKVGYEAVAGDLDALCAGPGLDAAVKLGGVDEVIITLMDRPVERGITDPDATMFIGVYLPTESGCVWE
ncbi:DUF6497 family protein [Tropicimonas sp. IMCC34043]|uniref:DUF6497 family protein n=1 Tax=Tropicimonas sp. IMCC34043 TaxID=2248760 RepID=UPI000E22C4BE|nr:DUF6497 family protein [Tropicimonas sp. IMCC34043]